ncbi:MAG: YbhB/YbcL family Raf kinase inhibitor-like protein [Oscillospiraceae bacterium]|nr:YbhB/YbcL family Raf kinase inhibitor-like protein [Oscillospiraceae bacterium]
MERSSRPLTGDGGEKGRPQGKLKVTSPSFQEGGWIPPRFCGYGDDLSPELRIEGIEEGGVSMVIALDDMDHPLFPGYNHWIAWDILPVKVIPEGLPAGPQVEKPIPMRQGMGYGKHCYRGPKPPFNWNHTYRFTVYILDLALGLDPAADKKAVEKAMEGHILQTGTLTGKFQRRHP